MRFESLSQAGQDKLGGLQSRTNRIGVFGNIGPRRECLESISYGGLKSEKIP